MSILADLSPVGALALRDYYVAWQTLDREPYRADGRHYGPGMDGDNYGIDTARGLVRRGLLEPSWIEFDNYRLAGEDDRYGDYPESLNPIRLAGDLSSVAMTQYGKRFCRAVGMAGDPTGCGPDPTSPRRLAGLMPHAVGLRNVVYVGARVGVLRAGQPIFNKVYLTPEHPKGSPPRTCRGPCPTSSTASPSSGSLPISIPPPSPARATSASAARTTT